MANRPQKAEYQVQQNLIASILYTVRRVSVTLLELLSLLANSISFYISYSNKLDRYIFYLDNLSYASTSLIPYKKALIKYKKARK